MATQGHPLRATYRIQAHRDFGFDRIAELADYLAELGVSHVYLSPILTAVAGSQHGYDVVDHEHVNAELGGEPAHERMCRTLREYGLGQVLDIVPNHMAVGTPENRLWWDVLENGPASQYASFFDVDWESSEDTRVLLPILGEHYADALQQHLVLVLRHDAEFIVHYHDHRMPAAPRSIAQLLQAAAPEHDELTFLADALAELPAPRSIEREALARRQRDKHVLFAYLKRLLDGEPELAQRIDAQLTQLNADVPALDAWLERQNWRIVHWHNASTEIGYRRFFDVNTLAGLRIEDQRVFDRVHRLILRWVQQGTLDGLRVDHVDGLRDPTQYLQRLRQAAPASWIVVEKILHPGETLDASWPIDGTTGYDFIYLLDQVFVDQRGESELTELDQRWTGFSAPWEARAISAKLQIVREVLASERERLIDLAQRALTPRFELRDCTRQTLSEAVTALLVSYPVYRTYVRPGATSDHDRDVIAQVIARASALAPGIDARVFEALREVLSLEANGEAATELALRVQQVTGAIMAKAIEDTLFYRYSRLLALNEVGGAPERFGLSLAEFHGTLQDVSHPHAMLGSATHDTKRGEDTRARLLALSELPQLWAQAVERWSARAQRHKDDKVDGGAEYFFYQTLVGAFPLSVERALAYMQKALREAKVKTSWIHTDPEYEAAIEKFIRGVLSDAELMEDVARFVMRIAPGAYVTSLARTLLKLTAPGVPDLYRGTELWDFSLVDPDNRAPVDFSARRALLAHVREATPEAVLADMESGAPKLFLIYHTLRLRKQSPELFEGGYRRLPVEGPDADHVIAYARGDALICVVPRLNAHGEPRSRTANLTLPAGSYHDIFTAERFTDVTQLATSALWARFPVALLVRET
jgi:(1->4)-alpha-D-glucan 1-alpha-D-glucosylmutase